MSLPKETGPYDPKYYSDGHDEGGRDVPSERTPEALESLLGRSRNPKKRFMGPIRANLRMYEGRYRDCQN